jgi:signal transduction histidine kinase
MAVRLRHGFSVGDRGTSLACAPVLMTPTFLEDLKVYVGFDDDASAALRALHPHAQASFGPIVDDFYAAIEAHSGARAAITGGEAQIARLKQTLHAWLDRMLLGPHDAEYCAMRARIGRVHVRIALPQHYMFTAMNRIRVRLLDVVQTWAAGREEMRRLCAAVNQIIDIDLAIMLETYREDLEEKSRNTERLATIGQFAASVGHELRNPLGVIESSLFILRQNLGADAQSTKVARHLERIGIEVERANQTITQVLELARDKPPRRRPTDLRALIEDATRLALLPAAVTCNLEVARGVTANVDAEQLRQVFINLVMNASQAMGGRGHLWIEGAPLGEGGVRLRVRDDGPGVPPEARRRIFEALFTTKAKGSGLGLALCRRIIERHGGTIDLEDTPAGASFLMTIPNQ